LLTRRRAAVFPQDCPQPPPMDWPGCEVQNLHYHYDPVGNISRIRDEAQQTVFFLNRRVEPSADYTHDATYRLIEATGREHLGQIQGAPIPHSHDDRSRMGLYHPSDGNAMGTYTERYGYDAAGNLVRMLHSGSSPNHLGWTRNYDYHEPSLIEPQKVNNRLSVTTVGTNNPITERWVHDLHGSMIRMPHLGGTHPAPNLHWDHRDQLRRADLGGGGTVDYTYDITGQRVRKVWQKSSNLIEERIYFSGFEIYRRRQGAELLERETLHIHDDQQRIALVETRTVDTAGTDSAPPQLIRYQFGNHLGSASLELDDQAQLISYEEYTPYGSTSYQAVRSQTETPKRYRFTGKERDEETGLFYHGARYYAPWLGRWTAADPMGLSDGNNVFAYVRNRPINLTDPTGTDGEAVSTRESPMSFNNWEYFAEANAHRFQSYEHARVAWYQARGLDPYKSACMPPDPEPPPPPPPPPQAAHPSPAPKQKQIGLPFQHVRNEVLIPVESFPDTGNWAGNTFHWTMGYTYNSMAFLVNSGLATLDQADKIKRSMLKSIGFSSYDIQAMDDTLLVTSMTSRGPLVIRNGVAGGIIFLQAQAAQSKREAQAARRVISFLGSYGMAGMPIVSPGKVSADKFARRAQGLDDAATMKVGLNKGAKEADKVKVVAKVEIEGQEFYGSNAFSSNQNNPFMDLNARPGHAEIDALGQAAGSVNTTGRSAEMWVTESLCSGACLGSKFGGNVPKAMQQMGLEKLTIHTPTESFVLTPQGVIFHRVY